MAAPRKDNVKEHILSTAASLLETSSFRALSLSELARKAGISTGTLYYHYHSKGEILFDLTDRYLNEQWADFIRWTENKDKDTSMSRLIKYVLERNTVSAALRLRLLAEAQTEDPELRKKLVRRYGDFQRLFAQKIAERCDLPADYTAWLLLLLSDGIIVQKSLYNENFDADSFLEQTRALIHQYETMPEHTKKPSDRA